ncbi:hypothetical protein [Streptomyces sp. enrichment culture]|uniref:hypothetical protein n=1 Tax=Streptomyces sp. enrichment culture TaxID=1795815 RepID=UPI003F55417F
MSLLPLFEDGAGRRSADPLALASPVARVDLEALALLLAPPALLGEFIPAPRGRASSGPRRMSRSRCPARCRKRSPARWKT